MKRAEDLLAAAAKVDVLDVAGAILANPDRAMVSLAAKVAMASALERCWAVCLEADLLATALLGIAPGAGDLGPTTLEILERGLEQTVRYDDARPHALHIERLATAVHHLMAALHNGAPLPQTQQEKNDGNLD